MSMSARIFRRPNDLVIDDWDAKLSHSLRTAAAFMLCPLPFPSPLPYAPHRAHGLVAWLSNADTVFVDVFETVEQWTSLSAVCA